MTEVRPELAELTVPMDQVSPLPGNPRRGNVEVIVDSLLAHGQFRPILVQQSTGHIIAGNHTWQAAQQLEWEHVAAQFLDVDDETAQRIALVDNRTDDLADWDNQALHDLLADLPDLDGTGFTGDDLDDLLASLTGGAGVEASAAASDAHYVETPEKETARAENFTTHSTLAAKGLGEVTFVLNTDDKEELLREVEALREHVGDIPTGDVMLRASKVARVVLDNAKQGAQPADWGVVAREAGVDLP